MPVAGTLCNQNAFFGGWPSIFYLSASVGLFFIIVFLCIGADKPSKQFLITDSELHFIMKSIACEDAGKKRIERKIKWRPIITSAPVWAGIISVVCHEYPLMTMIMFLPRYHFYVKL